MRIGYISDEQYVALAGVICEFHNDQGESWEATSRASGSVYVELPPGDYRVALQKAGYGSKFSNIRIPVQHPYQFRLLRDGLLGYVWPKWVCGGEQAEFRIHSVQPYRLELWHYGWDKSLVQKLGWHDEHGPRATMQVTPDGDYTQTGIDWNRVGYQSAGLAQHVTAPLRSGLYYFHAHTSAGTQFGFPWVVGPARGKPNAPIAVLMSTITWNAYNNVGGRSNYIHADCLPNTPTVNARMELSRYCDPGFSTWNCPSYAPLAFERPEPINHIDIETRITDPIAGRAACHVAPAEWRLLGWLQDHGWPYDVYSENQLHDGTLDLSAYRLLILSVHPEYWTRTMYERTKQWVFEEGGRLMYLGGNGLNCEVTLHPQATMTVHNGQIGGLWASEIGAESRFALRVESEANLLGVVFDPAGIMTGAPYRVIEEGHWVFQDTGLRAGQLFGERSLHERCPGGASGHETDKISASSPPNVQLLAKGTNVDSGGAEMTVFDTPRRGGVFAAGSISWVSSLPVDEGVSRVTDNVIRRFLE